MSRVVRYICLTINRLRICSRKKQGNMPRVDEPADGC